MPAGQPVPATLCRGGQPLQLRCPGCSRFRCDLCEGGSCGCLHRKAAIIAQARQRYATSSSTGTLAESLGMLLALDLQRSARAERMRRRGPVTATCGWCGARFAARSRRARWCSEAHRQAAYGQRVADRLALAGSGPPPAAEDDGMDPVRASARAWFAEQARWDAEHLVCRRFVNAPYRPLR